MIFIGVIGHPVLQAMKQAMVQLEIFNKCGIVIKEAAEPSNNELQNLEDVIYEPVKNTAKNYSKPKFSHAPKYIGKIQAAHYSRNRMDRLLPKGHRLKGYEKVE